MKTLAKKDLVDVLAAWAREYDVISPLKREQGDTIFDTFDGKNFTLDYGKPALSPKSVCFPQSEITFTVEKGNYSEVIPGAKTLIFGIRACDMTGMLQTSSFMTRDREDIYYRRRREDTLAVVMACSGPQNETCFCTTTSSGPWVERGFDLQFYDMGETFLVDAGSEAGKKLIQDGRFTDTDGREAKERLSSFKAEAAEQIKEVPEVRKIMASLEDGSVNGAIWDYLGDKCITCGGCTFVCPTCTCFNVYDQVTETDGGLRVRAWDACLYGGFTREASGHNPRGSQALRIKRRYEHKLLYYNETDIQGAISGCVGCGRCSDYCPVHIGVLEVARAVAEE